MELKELTFGKIFKLAFKAIPAFFLAQLAWIAIVFTGLTIVIAAMCFMFDINPVYYLYYLLLGGLHG